MSQVTLERKKTAIPGKRQKKKKEKNMTYHYLSDILSKHDITSVHIIARV